MTLLFTNQTADGDSTEFDNTGGRVQVQISGVFGTAVLQPQISQDGLPFGDFGTVIAAADVLLFFVELKQCKLRFVLSTAGGGTNLNLSVV